MKKILVPLTGITLLILILIAGACKPPPDQEAKNYDKVEIYCKAFIENEVLKFEMYHSNDDTKVFAIPSKEDSKKLVANHVTDIAPGAKVKWIWTNDSEIDQFVKIGPPTPGEIITGNAKKILFTNKFKLRIPKKATDGQERYDIVFKDKVDNQYVIDPYLKIRPKVED